MDERKDSHYNFFEPAGGWWRNPSQNHPGSSREAKLRTWLIRLSSWLVFQPHAFRRLNDWVRLGEHIIYIVDFYFLLKIALINPVKVHLAALAPLATLPPEIVVEIVKEFDWHSCYTFARWDYITNCLYFGLNLSSRHVKYLSIVYRGPLGSRLAPSIRSPACSHGAFRWANLLVLGRGTGGLGITEKKCWRRLGVQRRKVDRNAK